MRKFLSGLITDVIKSLTSKITVKIGSDDVVEADASLLALNYGGGIDNPVRIGADYLDYTNTDSTIKYGLVTFSNYDMTNFPEGFFAIGGISQATKNTLVLGGGAGPLTGAQEINLAVTQNIGDAASTAANQMEITWGEVNINTTLTLDNAASAANHAVRKDQLDAHTGNAAIHRSINDAATGTTDLWSASKITSELANKSDVGHNHNNLYYTETEVDSMVNAIYTEIDKGEVKVDTDDNDKDVLINKVSAGPGIAVSKDASGADNVLKIANWVFPADVPGMGSTTRKMPCYVDTEKSNKTLSVETFTQSWGADGLNDQEGVIGAADPARILIPFDATIVGIAVHADSIGANAGYDLLVNGSTASADFFTTSNGSNIAASDFTKNYNLSAGDYIGWKIDVGLFTSINNCVITVYIKWRA